MSKALFDSAVFRAILQLLDDEKQQYELSEHAVVATSEDSAKETGLPIAEAAKSILLKHRNGFLLVVLPGNEQIDYKKVKAFVGVKKIRLATRDEVEEVMGVSVGACYPLGFLAPKKVQMVIDGSFKKKSNIHFSPGTHIHHIRITLNTFIAIARPTFVEIIRN